MVQVMRRLVPTGEAVKKATRAVAYWTLATVVMAGLWITYDWWNYHMPAHRAPLEVGMVRDVIIKGQWIGLPLDVTREAECLTQSTFTLRRPDLANPKGGIPITDDVSTNGREDVFILGLSNTTLTGLGTHHITLWFHRPDDLPGGGWWEIVNKSESDCGAPGNKSVSDPVTSILGRVQMHETP